MTTEHSAKKPAVQVRDLHKKYGDIEVLKGISFSENKGGITSIIGSSGSGKSTLLRCMNMLETPQSGLLDIAGENFDFANIDFSNPGRAFKKRLRGLRSRVTMVFQEFNLWPHMSVRSNVTEIPIRVLKRSKKEAIEIADVLLDKVGMYSKRNEYPAFLSGGQKQRVAIARALAADPEVLLFDEPTSALDPELVNEVLGVIRGLADEGRTMLLVTHEMRFAREISSQILYLHEGLVEACGTPEEIFVNSSSERCRRFVTSGGR